MKNPLLTSLCILLLTLVSSLRAQTTYPGNGNSGFESAVGLGGAVGLGSLTLSNDGTTIFGTITKGPSNFNDCLVIYIDSTPGGYASTANFADGNDGLRKAISGFDGGITNRSTLTFAAGFLPDYAIALGPTAASFGGLWQVTEGSGNSLNYISDVFLSPLTNNSATYTFSFPISSIGLTPESGATFRLFATYISGSGYRSDEAIAGNLTGTQGWNPFTNTTFSSYTLNLVATATALSTSNIDITVPTSLGHTYSLESSTTLAGWSPVGTASAGTGFPITLTTGTLPALPTTFVRATVSPTPSPTP